MTYQEIQRNFDDKLQTVETLVCFDELLITLIEKQVKDIVQINLKQQFDNPKRNGQKLLEFITTIKQNDTLKITYKNIYNQCCILLVSHFSNTIESVFQKSVLKLFGQKKIANFKKIKMELSIPELLSLKENTHRTIIQNLITKKDISFQDMQSINRAFKKYVGIDLPKDELTNDLIIITAIRHLHTHKNSIIDERFLNQIGNTTPNSFNLKFKKDNELSISKELILTFCKRTKEYVKKLINLCEMKVG